MTSRKSTDLGNHLFTYYVTSRDVSLIFITFPVHKPHTNTQTQTASLIHRFYTAGIEMQVTWNCPTCNPTTSTLLDKSIANIAKRDLGNIPSHIQNDSVPSHSHLRAVFVDRVASPADKNKSSVLHTGEKISHFMDVQTKPSVFAWFNFGLYSK